MKRLAVALLGTTALAQPVLGQTIGDRQVVADKVVSPVSGSGLQPCSLNGAVGLCYYKPVTGLVSLPLAEVQIPHTMANPMTIPGLSNTSHNGDTGGNGAVANDPSTTVAATQHWYSGQNVLGSLVLDIIAQSATKAEQTIVARMISSTGTPGNVPSYKMAFGAETIANAGSSPAFGATIVAQYNSGYSNKNPFGTLELDMNQLSGYDCPQADEGAPNVIGCSVVGITGVTGNKVRAGISIVGGNSILNGIQFNSGGPISNDILSYSGAQNLVADAGSHVNGINLQGGTYSGNAFIGPGSTSIIGSDGSYSGKAISVSFGLTGASHVANGSPLSYWALDAASSTTTLSSGAVAKLPAGRGLVLVSNNVDGNNCAFLIGNGASTLLGQVGTSCAAAASSGKVSLSYNSSTSAYSVANGLGSTAVLTIADMRNGTGN